MSAPGWEKERHCKRATLTIPGTPATKKNSMVARCVNGKPLLLQSRSYRAYEKAALQVLKGYAGPRFSGPVQVTARYWLKTTRRPDLNNLMASTGDILEKAGIIRNDRDIWSWDGSRIEGCSPNPRTEVTIVALTPEIF